MPLIELLRHPPLRRRLRRTFDEYARTMADEDAGFAAKRGRYEQVVNQFYDLVTDFYEYGWGQSFHFAARFRGETLREALTRFEHALALRLQLRPGVRVLDVGCGVGGPMRTMARLSGATILGVNNNEYQIARANRHIRAAGLEHLCSVQRGDFMALDLPSDSFDCAYAVAATCHAPSLQGVYQQVARVLKPGGLFACVEWCTTEPFDPADRGHRRLYDEIVVGNGMMGIASTDEALAAARAAGFEVVDCADLAATGDIPWYEPLAPRGLSLAAFRSSATGRRCTGLAVGALEALRLAPRGARLVARFLDEAAVALVEAGRAGIFTPDFLIVMRKPPPGAASASPPLLLG